MDWLKDDLDFDANIVETLDDSHTDFDRTETYSPQTSKSTNRKNRKDFINSRICGALDNAKVSDGMAVHILIAVAEALGHRIEELSVSKTTLNRKRRMNRYQQAEEIRNDFADNVNTFSFKFV